MLTVDDYGRIRRAHRDGMSIRAMARTFHHSQRKIREVLVQPEPRPYTRSKGPPAPKLGPFHAVIDEILAADEKEPRKQRHTRAQIFRRLWDEHGYRGGCDAVRRRSATCAGVWSSNTAPRPERVSTSASCNCWPNILSPACNTPSGVAGRQRIGFSRSCRPPHRRDCFCTT